MERMGSSAPLKGRYKRLPLSPKSDNNGNPHETHPPLTIPRIALPPVTT